METLEFSENPHKNNSHISTKLLITHIAAANCSRVAVFISQKRLLLTL